MVASVRGLWSVGVAVSLSVYPLVFCCFHLRVATRGSFQYSLTFPRLKVSFSLTMLAE